MMVKRFNISGRDYTIDESEYGEFVDSQDYQNLEDELSDLQMKYDNLVKALGELYQDS